ncbi:MAG: hypothetical protein ABJB85_10395 [Nitrososphaerota archaeon]
MSNDEFERIRTKIQHFAGDERKRINKISDGMKQNLGYITEIDEAKEEVINSINEFESRILDYLPKRDRLTK